MSSGHNNYRLVETKRDWRIDFARGLALICILVDHIPNNPMARLTLQSFGFADASEVFVFLAGVSAALAYGPTAKIAGVAAVVGRILARAHTMFLAHLSLIALLVTAGFLLSVFGASPVSVAQLPLEHFQAHPMEATLQGVLLLWQPKYLDILPLYVVLFVGFLPPFLWLANKSLPRAMLMSVAVWFVAGAQHINFPGHRDGGWYFNPFAWQLCFAAGVGLGLLRLKNQKASRNGLLKAGAALYLIFAFLAAAPWTILPIGAIKALRFVDAETLHAMSKTDLSGWRFFHVLCLFYLAGTIVPLRTPRPAMPLLDWITVLGQRSLPAFVLTSLLSHAVTVIAAANSSRPSITVAMNGVGIIVLYLFARLWHPGAWRKYLARPAPSTPSAGSWRRIVLAIIITLPVALYSAHASSGEIERQFFTSASSGRAFAVTIYHSTTTNPEQNLPLVYVLHGADSSSAEFLDQGGLKETADRLVAQNIIPPAIFVILDGGNCWWVDSQNCNIESFFWKELHPYVQSHLPVSRRREDTYLLGVSAGGFGALRYALQYADQIGAAALLSPAIYTEAPPSFSVVRQRSPFVQGSGAFDMALWQRTNYPALLPAYVEQPLRVHFYVACGDADPFGIPLETALLRKRLTAIAGQSMQLRIGEGSHTWSFWKPAIADALISMFAGQQVSSASASQHAQTLARINPRVTPEFGRW